MALIRAQVVLPYTTNLPADVITNTLHFQSGLGIYDITCTVIRDALQEFYGSAMTPQGGFANWINWANAHVNFYNMGDDPPRVPLTLGLTIPGVITGASTIPAEVSVVLSFQGDPESGVPQARRRGRIYMGGWQAPIQASLSTSPPRLITELPDQIGEAASQLRSSLIGDDIDWVVYSPTYSLETSVTNGWVDSEPDTQRRRGLAASSRALWPD